MYDVICNARSGSGRGQKIRSRVENAFAAAGAKAVFHEPASAEEAKELVGKLSLSGAKNIVVMGGDGSINTVLNGIRDFSNLSLGIIPCGSGNDFATRIGLPTVPEKAVEILLHSEPKPTDFYECAGIRGLNAVGAGIDVEILETYSKMKVLRGKIKYLASLIKVLFHFDLYPLSLQRESGPEPHSSLILCVCNGSTFGGGIKICPTALPDDGFLNLVLVENLPKRKISGAFVKLMQGKILEQDYTLTEKVREIHATFEKPVSVQIDGEIYPNLPFDVKIVSDTLKILRP